MRGEYMMKLKITIKKNTPRRSHHGEHNKEEAFRIE